jgi:hypothetical protein
LVVIAIVIKEKEGRIEVVWLGSAEYQWGNEGLLKEYGCAVSRHDAKQAHVEHIQMADQMIPMGWACLAR